ncbi:hypothetical protein LX87_05589 [Larkinella arboricola]|uniref:Uncharacterized protein n=1 Tax=Larkinella arboricola TaxID=643671 RepID=A0A327WIY0_LARAB|nr:hypothetical protein LX87_05589 [Larkinella arboricola]
MSPFVLIILRAYWEGSGDGMFFEDCRKHPNWDADVFPIIATSFLDKRFQKERINRL